METFSETERVIDNQAGLYQTTQWYIKHHHHQFIIIIIIIITTIISTLFPNLTDLEISDTGDDTSNHDMPNFATYKQVHNLSNNMRPKLKKN